MRLPGACGRLRSSPGLAAGRRSRSRIRPASQPRPHDRSGGRPDPARATEVPRLRHQHRHLHRRHPALRAWKRPAEAHRCSAPRRRFFGARPRRHRLRPRFSRAMLIFARGLLLRAGIGDGNVLAAGDRPSSSFRRSTSSPSGSSMRCLGVAVAGAISMPMVNRLLGRSCQHSGNGHHRGSHSRGSARDDAAVVGIVVTLNGACWMTTSV